MPLGHTRPGAAFDGSHAERGNHHEKYGSIVPLPYPHSAPIDEAGSAAWLDCMAQAIARQDCRNCACRRSASSRPAATGTGPR